MLFLHVSFDFRIGFILDHKAFLYSNISLLNRVKRPADKTRYVIVQISSIFNLFHIETI